MVVTLLSVVRDKNDKDKRKEDLGATQHRSIQDRSEIITSGTGDVKAWTKITYGSFRGYNCYYQIHLQMCECAIKNSPIQQRCTVNPSYTSVPACTNLPNLARFKITVNCCSVDCAASLVAYKRGRDSSL